jgi:anaerobic magnesium-protoporphyrin IX monomethyl ester cyclase
MADVLLTHSYHLPYDRKQVRKMQPYAPLGTLYAATALRRSGVSVAVFDTMLLDPNKAFEKALEQHTPQIVVIYEDDFNFLSKMCLTRMREVAWDLARQSKEAGAVVVAHGSDASDHTEAYLRNGIDYVLCGEAEAALAELCGLLLKGDCTEGVAGLRRLNERGVLAGVESPLLKNPSWTGLRAPSRELIDLEPYRRAWKTAHGYFSANVVASRGCPYRCNWCAKPISGNKHQLRAAAEVAAEILELKDLYAVEHIWFGDDIFALNRHWTAEFAAAMEANRCVMPFKIQSRVDLMTEETVALLARAGCAEVWMGIESGSQKILDAMDKGIQAADIGPARERLRAAGIRACYFLQFGYPGENWNEIEATVRMVRATRPDEVGISLSYPLPGTVFYERVQKELGAKRNWTDSDDLCVIFTGAYKNEFYLALRDAIHAEVDSWHGAAPESQQMVNALWRNVRRLERVCRNPPADTAASVSTDHNEAAANFIPLQQLAVSASEA